MQIELPKVESHEAMHMGTINAALETPRLFLSNIIHAEC